ncbi:MAG: hypothetical protein ACKOEC_22810 [Acidimicrobiia bacterium]
MKLIVGGVAVLMVVSVAMVANARVTREKHEIYLEAATAAGGCKDKEFLTKLEQQYSACQATDAQHNEMLKAYDNAKETSCNRKTMYDVQTMWNLSGGFARELRIAGASGSNC